MANLEIFQKTVGQLGTNCYILVNHDTHECVVFDPGGEPEVLKEIFSSPALSLKAIFLTHGHWDHIGAVKELKNTYQVPVYASKEENEQVLITHIKVRGGTLEQNTGCQVGKQEHLYEHYQQTTLSVIPPPIQFLDLLIILRHNSVLPRYLHIDFSIFLLFQLVGLKQCLADHSEYTK